MLSMIDPLSSLCCDMECLDGAEIPQGDGYKHLTLIETAVCMLLALTRPSRSVDLAALQVDRCYFSPEDVAFLPAALAKQSRQGKG